MRAEKDAIRLTSPILFGAVGAFCAVLGLFAWAEYGAFAMTAMREAISHDSGASYRAARYADGFRFIQMLFGFVAVLLGWASLAQGSKARIAKGLVHGALWSGVGVLILSLLLV